jgi:hypothetical protein
MEKCSGFAKSVKVLLDTCDQSVFEKEDLVLSGAVWSSNSYDTYLSLLEESEYAADVCIRF